jgi:HK97 family phage major capsid protein
MTINELREKRNSVWEKAKAFLASHRNESGVLSAEDTATYEAMEKEVVDLGAAIKQLERQEAMEREMNAATSTPITTKPAAGAKADPKTGRASDAYTEAFWKQARNNTSYDIRNALQVGVDTEGGYLCPDTFENQLVTGLTAKNVVRGLAHVISTSSGQHKIPVVANRGTASWVEEEGPIPEGDDTFGQQYIGAHKVGTLIKVSEELLNDSAFDLEAYFVAEFARRIGNKEEEAFLNGDGAGKPTGILNDAEVGVTAASATAITADELIDLFYSLPAPYRANAVWVMNDSTMRYIRKLKDTTGQFLWQKALHEGEHETLLGKPIYHSPFAPEVAAGAKPILFGDLSYYWIGDRKGITFRRLNERYADTGQVGFLATKRVDGKLILPEAIKCLQMKGA